MGETTGGYSLLLEIPYAETEATRRESTRCRFVAEFAPRDGCWQGVCSQLSILILGSTHSLPSILILGSTRSWPKILILSSTRSQSSILTLSSTHSQMSILAAPAPPSTPFPNRQSLSCSHSGGTQGCWDACRGYKQHPKSTVSKTVAPRAQPPSPNHILCPLEHPQVMLAPTLALRPCAQVGMLVKDLLIELSLLVLAIAHILRARDLLQSPLPGVMHQPCIPALGLSPTHPSGPRYFGQNDLFFCSKRPTQTA